MVVVLKLECGSGVEVAVVVAAVVIAWWSQLNDGLVSIYGNGGNDGGGGAEVVMYTISLLKILITLA